jgi:hypothetical protein
MLIAQDLPGTFTPVHTDSVLVKMLKGVEAFYDWLSGPPMTKRDRMYRELAECIPGFEMNRINT